ncbi:MAG: RecX family transcriptional regulator [Paludibacter sp.]|nr:RecX family transcriptional regulator [Paludibacter sp.]
MKEYTFDELLHKAASYCSISEHCTSEVELKLKTWGLDSNKQNQLIDRLIDEGFINERRYCLAFVKDKFLFNKWGKIKIAYALKQKGLDSKLISSALNTIDEGQYEEMLSEILKSKLKTIKWEYEYEKMGKLFQFAQSRGFESAVIDKVVRTL